MASVVIPNFLSSLGFLGRPRLLKRISHRHPNTSDSVYKWEAKSTVLDRLNSYQPRGTQSGSRERRTPYVRT